jgi:hypothetical protein
MRRTNTEPLAPTHEPSTTFGAGTDRRSNNHNGLRRGQHRPHRL